MTLFAKIQATATAIRREIPATTVSPRTLLSTRSATTRSGALSRTTPTTCVAGQDRHGDEEQVLSERAGESLPDVGRSGERLLHLRSVRVVLVLDVGVRAEHADQVGVHDHDPDAFLRVEARDDRPDAGSECRRSGLQRLLGPPGQDECVALEPGGQPVTFDPFEVASERDVVDEQDDRDDADHDQQQAYRRHRSGALDSGTPRPRTASIHLGSPSLRRIPAT